ncbi:MAG TPA: hypothetical protein VFS62_09415 [Chloroflexota bacterium]|jgi:hypothetical protein|nr:hypothetical protein [Chloroflexota bacterium]
MIPPSEPNLSMTALRAEERAISGSGTNLAVPKVQVPAPAQIVGQQVHLSVPAVQIAPPAQIVGTQPHIGAQIDKRV